MKSEDDALIKDFVTESRDMLDDAEAKLILMNQESTGGLDMEIINSIFRLFHTIKGSAGFLQLKNLASVTHEAETLLDLFRKGKAQVSSRHVNLLCSTCDFIRNLLSHVDNAMSDTGFENEAAGMVKSLANSMHAGPILAPTPILPPIAPPPTTQSRVESPATIPSASGATPAAATSPRVSATKARDMNLVLTPDMIRLFIQDSDDLIENAEHILLRMAKEPENVEKLMAEALRAIHTLKGNCGFFGYRDMEQVSHKTETVLQAIRDHLAPMNDANLQILLNIIDILKTAMANLSKKSDASIPRYEIMIQVLDEMLPETAKNPAAKVAPDNPDTDSSTDMLVFPLSASQELAPTAPLPSQQEPPPLAGSQPAPEPAQNESMPHPDAPTFAKEPEQAGIKTRAEATGGSSVSRRDIRVDVDKLDILNNLMGELVIAASMVTHNQDLAGLRLDNFERAAHQLNRITADMQDISMSLRMVPISATFRKMIRLVHDLSTKAGKKLELKLVGEDTEVDKNVAELIADPLVHMVRNSADHGLDSEDERQTRGKTPVGTVTLTAKHQSGEVWIIVSDDGRGLNRDKILAKGIERGLVKGDGSDLTDSDIYNLIFEPGFSTADRVTDVSGRGVGMDVVRRNIEKLRGRIEIQTKPGFGTSFTIRIPLTLAIIQGMLVRVGVERYIIPILTIRESFRPDAESVKTVKNQGEMIQIRGNLLPLFRLCRLFKTPGAIDDPTQGVVTVVEDGGRRAALMTDELLGQQEVVIKSLGDSFGQIDGVSGASILSDGHVGLILDIAGMLKAVEEERG